MLAQHRDRFWVKTLFFHPVEGVHFSIGVLTVPSTTCLISNRTGASLGNKLLSQGEIEGNPVQPVGQLKQNTAKAFWEEGSGLVLADLGRWLVQVTVEGRSSSTNSWPDVACVPFSAPLGWPCLMDGGWEGEGVQTLRFRHKKYQMIWKKLSEAIQKFPWDFC